MNIIKLPTNLLPIGTSLVVSILSTGCTTYGKCPAPPKLEKPLYAIYELPTNANISDKAKAMVISWNQCTTALDQCYNVLDRYK